MLYPPISMLGASEVALSGFGAATALVLPAANVAGLVLRSLALIGDTSANVAVYVGTAAPATPTDTARLCVARVLGSAGGLSLLTLPALVPAGYGVYAVGSVAHANNNVAISYDLR